MSMASPVYLRNWTVEDVTRWLSSINLTHLATRFEMANVSGDVLCRMDEGHMPMSLKLNPAEKTTVIASVKALKEQSMQHRNTLSSTLGTSPHTRNRSATDHVPKNRRSVPAITSVNLPVSPPPRQTDVVMPQYKDGSAGDVLDDNCRHSGWIRKRGGGYKTWKRRYLVLRLGFAYYYESEYSTKAKGHFCLYNCKVEPCTDSDKINKYKWVFKIIPEDPKQRTFFVSTAARHEMEKWIQVINEEIERFIARRLSDRDEEDYEHIYDPVCEDDDDEEQDAPLYEGLIDDEQDNNDDDEDDDPYTKILDEFPDGINPGGPHLGGVNMGGAHMGRVSPGGPISPGGTHMGGVHTRLDEPHPLPPPPSNPGGPPAWQMVDPLKSRKGMKDAPVIPPRSQVSMDPRKPQKEILAPPPAPLHAPPHLIEEENPYLTILKGNEKSTTPPAPSQPLAPSPNPPRNSGYVDVVPGFPLGGGPPPIRNTPRPIDNNSQYPMDRSSDVMRHQPQVTQADIEEENPYYIRLETLDEMLPDYCMFGNIERNTAESYLSKTGRIGTYLLRDGAHKGAYHVLSVLTNPPNSKHYKLYYKEDSHCYCLTEGKMFPSLAQLIEYYKQEDLPKTPNIKLSEPYHPLDY